MKKISYLVLFGIVSVIIKIVYNLAIGAWLEAVWGLPIIVFGLILIKILEVKKEAKKRK